MTRIIINRFPWKTSNCTSLIGTLLSHEPISAQFSKCFHSRNDVLKTKLHLPGYLVGFYKISNQVHIFNSDSRFWLTFKNLTTVNSSEFFLLRKSVDYEVRHAFSHFALMIILIINAHSGIFHSYYIFLNIR